MLYIEFFFEEGKNLAKEARLSLNSWPFSLRPPGPSSHTCIPMSNFLCKTLGFFIILTQPPVLAIVVFLNLHTYCVGRCVCFPLSSLGVRTAFQLRSPAMLLMLAWGPPFENHFSKASQVFSQMNPWTKRHSHFPPFLLAPFFPKIEHDNLDLQVLLTVHSLVTFLASFLNLLRDNRYIVCFYISRLSRVGRKPFLWLNEYKFVVPYLIPDCAVFQR